MQRKNKKRWEKVKKLNLKWYALIHHYDKEKLDPYNVLYEDMVYDVDKVIDNTNDYEKIKYEVSSWLSWMFRSRTEYEWIASQWTGKEFEEKIDIYDQVIPNIDVLTEYLILKLAPRRYKDIMTTKKTEYEAPKYINEGIHKS